MYEVVKWVHIVSSTVLFGTGLGTAFHMWMTFRRGSAVEVAASARNTVIADWLFTLPAGLLQPLSGVALIYLTGRDGLEPWLMVSYVLYALAMACWIPVVAIQIKVARIARLAAETGRDCPDELRTLMRIWFALGWPAFISLLLIFWLMVSKPEF